MTIQIPNPGTGNGATGDNELVLWTKVKDNFNNQSHAASRLVGTADSQVPSAKDVLSLSLSTAPTSYLTSDVVDLDLLQGGTLAQVWRSSALNIPPTLTSGNWISVLTRRTGTASRDTFLQEVIGNSNDFYAYRNKSYNGWGAWNVPRTSANTTVDSNGFIKKSSPIVKVFAEKVELNDDAVTQGVTFVKNDIGDYTITTQSGLSTDGWYLELPKDLNGNPKIAVTLSETDGVINLKCYKRIFSMTTFTFEPDLDEPLDVPDGRWIDLRLNEIPNDDPNPSEV